MSKGGGCLAMPKSISSAYPAKSGRAKLLEELPLWSWDVLEDQWNEIFNALNKYIDEYGHMKIPRNLKYDGYYLGSWVKAQRINSDKLSAERIQQLESLLTWSWNPIEDQWNEGFCYLKKYIEEYDHSRIQDKLKYEGFNLGVWVSRQRKEKNKLSPEKIRLLEVLPKWSWNIHEDQWHENFKFLKKYVEKYGDSRVPLRFKYDAFNLGSWVSSQRRGKDKLDLKIIQLLEELPQWSWNILEDQWNERFEYLKKYIDEYGHARVSDDFNLCTWIATQKYTKDNLDLKKIEKLESLPQWSWNPFEDQWNEGFECLKKYVDEYGHARVHNKLEYKKFNLGAWVSTQRYKRDKLDIEKIQKLESLSQWSWNLLNDKWSEGFEHLKKYIEEYGCAKVPQNLKYGSHSLGQWVMMQKRSEKNNKLDLEKIRLLEDLPQWSWAVKKEN
jgi:hypothetical protein